MPKMQISASKVEAAAGLLKAEVGHLDDFTAELQNTIANVYYRMLCAHDAPDFSSGDFLKTIGDHQTFSVIAFTDYESIREVVESVRAIREQAKSADKRKISDSMAEVLDANIQQTLVDTYKYRIENANGKNAIRRSFERKFKTPIDEINGLYTLMKKFL